MTTYSRTRYYAFSPRIGRMRSPEAIGTEQADLVAWAQHLGADNLIKEVGPVRDPKSTIIWEREREVDVQRYMPLTPVSTWKASARDQAYEVLVAHFPNATVRQIGAVMAELEGLLKK